MGAAAVYAQYRQTEEPEFAVVSADADFELRDYPSLVVAEVSHSGSRERASGASFRRLAAYIFAQDRPAGGESIAMTAPVLQDETQPGEWRMRFVMPSKYTLETLPKAAGGALRIESEPGRGTRVEVLLPLSPENATALTAPAH